MTKVLTRFSIIAEAITLLIALSCNPFKEEKKKELVKVLVNDYLGETGRYVVYWDGKDKNGKYIFAGKYIYLLEVKDFQDQDFMTAEEGGRPGANNQEHFETGIWSNFELEPASPNPFKIKDGVNIPFLVSQPATVKISIFKD
jgi:hypothetical protein